MIKNNKGMSLIGTVMAMGISGVVIAGSMTMLNQMYKAQDRLVAVQDRGDIAEKLKLVLGKKSSCTTALAGVSFDTNEADLQRIDPQDVPMINDNTFALGKLSISETFIKVLNKTTDPMTVEITFNFGDKGGGERKYNLRGKTYEFSIPRPAVQGQYIIPNNDGCFLSGVPQINNNQAAPEDPALEKLVNGIHTVGDCQALGGLAYGFSPQKFCKLAVATCTGGWSRYGRWSTTEITKESYTYRSSSWKKFGCFFSQTITKSCDTGSHPFSALAPETLTCRKSLTVVGSFKQADCESKALKQGSVTVTAKVIEKGCY